MSLFSVEEVVSITIATIVLKTVILLTVSNEMKLSTIQSKHETYFNFLITTLRSWRRLFLFSR